MVMDAQKWKKILENAKAKTDREFASEASSLIRLTDDEIMEIAPQPLDKEKFAELMSIVKDATKSNEEKAKAIQNINGLAKIAVSLLTKLI